MAVAVQHNEVWPTVAMKFMNAGSHNLDAVRHNPRIVVGVHSGSARYRRDPAHIMVLRKQGAVDHLQCVPVGPATGDEDDLHSVLPLSPGCVTLTKPLPTPSLMV